MRSRRERAVPLILTVDDDATTRAFLRAYLEDAGFTVIDAASGEQALEQFAARQPDLVLLDVSMPGMDGFATCAAIRGMPSGAAVPVVMLTGANDLNAINRAYEVGATDFEVKSMHWVVLAQRLRYLLRASRAMDDLIQSEASLEAAQRIAGLGNWEWDAGSGRHVWSEETHRLLALPKSATAPTHRDFLGRIHPEDRSGIEAALEAALRHERSYSLEHRLLLPDGTERLVHAQAELVTAQDGVAAGLAGTLQDITERRRVEERIRRLAYFDAQTDLPNRILFQERVQQAIVDARRSRRLVALMFMDLDNFKRVNDTLGHSAGDQLLAEVAARLGKAVRDTDPLTRDALDGGGAVLARHGGDEFIVCLSGIARAEDAARVARRILSALNDPVRVNGREVYMTLSMGISLYPQDGQDVETLLKHADSAMYHAKNAGRNNYQFYDAALSSRAFHRLALETSLRRALERKEFVLHYQPIMDLAAERITAAEALIRWRHPELGLVSPDEFIPLAEETGLVVPIGEWVLCEAARFQRACVVAGHDLRVAVNVSGEQFRRPGLVDQVREAVAQAGTDANGLELEITETVLMQRGAEDEQMLRRLKDLGVAISMDDFGTGYSSLSYLRRFPVDTLKMDGTFVRGMESCADSAAITAAIAAMAKSLRVEPLAEGVECREQRDLLERQGFELMQGYFFGKPVAEHEFTTFMRAGAGQLARAGAAALSR